jgi:hypothetical protein
MYEGAAIGDNGTNQMRPLVSGDPLRRFRRAQVGERAPAWPGAP